MNMSDSGTMVFKHPGQYMQDGVSYEYQIVASDAVEEALADGWSLSVPEAKQAHDAALAAKGDSEDNAPPTREELEAKAKEMGLKFDGRTSDEKLAAKIAEALAAKG